MKTVTNKTSKPLRVPLPQGKTLFLGPLKSGQIAPKAEEHPAVKKLVEAGQLEIQEAGKAGPSGHEHGHGPHATTSPRGGSSVQQVRKGERGA
jgi:hypothetical protein